MITKIKELIYKYKYGIEIEAYANDRGVSVPDAKRACEEWGNILAQSHGSPSPCIGCMEFHCSRRGKKLIYCKDAHD